MELLACCQLSKCCDCATGNIYVYSDYCKTKGERRTCFVFSILVLAGPLVELLSSSKFTAGTWEQFICYLPKMTQDVIVGIKQNVEENETSPSYGIDAVAQHCQNIPDITWRSICIALISSNEVTLARQIFEKHSSKNCNIII